MQGNPVQANPVEHAEELWRFECQSCEATEDLVLTDDPDEPVFCRECRSPLRNLDFPEYYCDLGDAD